MQYDNGILSEWYSTLYSPKKHNWDGLSKMKQETFWQKEKNLTKE